MKIVFDTDKNLVKIGSKTFGFDMPIEKQNEILLSFRKFLKDNTKLSDFGSYDEDSMWMSYRYCIGRHTIASHMRANDIKDNCFRRMSDERSIFTAYDINREIERCLLHGSGPSFWFPVTSYNRIYTSAIDIFCQFVEDYNIQTKEDLLKYKEVHVKLYDNDRGYTLEVITWEEYLRPKVHEIVSNYYDNKDITEEQAWKYFERWKEEDDLQQEEMVHKFYKLTESMPNKDYFSLSSIDDLMVWNHLVHVFDYEHHHKSVLVDGSEVEWYWTYIHDTYQKEDGHYYRKEIGYKKVRVPIDSPIGDNVRYIPDNVIINNIY